VSLLRRHYHSKGAGTSTPSDDLLDTIHATISLATRHSGQLQPTWHAGQCKGPDGKSLVYFGSDGFMAPTITDAEKQARRKKVMVTRENCRSAGRLMSRDAWRLGFAAADFRVGNIDGGPWIISQIQRQKLNMTAVGLDFYHLSENVHKTRGIVFGEKNAQGPSSCCTPSSMKDTSQCTRG